ncbi:MAG TPA: hypothetical protein VF281_04825 [Candidatus Saccharimonadales bacterium]
MSETPLKTAADFVLPASVVTKVDVSRLVSEVEKLDSDLTTAAVRAKTGAPQAAQPTVSEQLANFLTQNKLAFDTSQTRSALVQQLRIVKDKVPVIHMTFAVQSDPESLQQIVQWLRSSVHPQAVISVGLQPSLVAGVYMRTPNHVHDLSLRTLLTGQHDVLVKELEALRGNV